MPTMTRAARPYVALVLAAIASLAVVRGVPAQAPPVDAWRKADARDWIKLFNGKDLTGWTPKFRGHPLGENYLDTLRVRDGVLQIAYDKWTAFNGEFGHIYYKEPFSYYVIAAEYRFVGEQPSGAPSWARRNNGLMLHSQPPETMLLDQDFPASLEAQLLGGLSDGKPRPTMNLCTPGTNVVMDGTLITAHCTNSASKTYDGDQWVRVEVVVQGAERIRHMVDGQVVLEFSKPQYGGGNVSPVNPALPAEGTLIDRGYITIQAESAPTEFRRIDVLDLEGCTDPKFKSYRSYFLKSNPARCK